MKTIRGFILLFTVYTFISCQEKNNVELTDFTKELISMYINDSDNRVAKDRKDEIIIVSYTDTLRYHLSVFANDRRSYKFCREDFVDETFYLGHLIRVFGEENSVFYSINEKNKRVKRCKEDKFPPFYDPLVWEFSLYKDYSFCKMKTYKVTADGHISAIQSLAEKYFKISETIIEDEIYQPSEIENQPQFSLGEDSLRKVISSNFKIRKEGNFDKIPIIVRIIVDKTGKAILEEIIKSSNDNELDKEAIRVTEIICQYDFIPATHRGETVNANYSIMFFNEDIIP